MVKESYFDDLPSGAAQRTTTKGENLPRPLIGLPLSRKAQLMDPAKAMHEAAELRDVWALVTLAQKVGL